MLTVLRPFAATGVETCGVVRRDRSTARELADKRICFATPGRRWNSRDFASAALDHG
jgi:hypothetical protein